MTGYERRRDRMTEPSLESLCWYHQKIPQYVGP